MRKEIASVGPLRIGIINALVLGGLYFISAIVWLLSTGLWAGMHRGLYGGTTGLAGGAAAIIVLGVVVWPLGGFLAGVIGGFLYNLAAGAFGGIIVELKDA